MFVLQLIHALNQLFVSVVDVKNVVKELFVVSELHVIQKLINVFVIDSLLEIQIYSVCLVSLIWLKYAVLFILFIFYISSIRQ